MVDEQYMAHRIAQVKYLRRPPRRRGCPFVKPAGRRHAIFIDAKAFLPQILQKLYLMDVLSIEIYREGAIRGIGLEPLPSPLEDAGRRVN
ncbi:MAG: hypothetical protein MZU95_07685 [Desulfomicrobium escambiense]|nr:hypothetical protein [Desulfomicrobium escambiense]